MNRDNQAKNTKTKKRTPSKTPSKHRLAQLGAPYRWKPGESGNPAGRPKSATLSEAYRARLNEVDPDDPHGRSFMDVIADRIVARAAKGLVKAATELADRTEGKAPQSLSLSGPGGAPLARPPVFEIYFSREPEGETETPPQLGEEHVKFR